MVGAAPAMERAAVALSFWFGGAGLAALKCVAWVATGSALVRTSMFESVGDVFSSAIMAVTQRAMTSRGDADASLYPVGKARFGPLGVLFFCAFMCSSMAGMAIDSVQALLAAGDEAGGQTGPGTATAAAAAAGEAVRGLLQDQPLVRGIYRVGEILGSSESVEEIAGRYAAAAADSVPPPVSEAANEDGNLPALLLFLCFVVKLALYIFCQAAQRRRKSDIVGALATDHMNDALSNLLVMGSMVGVGALRRRGYDSPWVDKVDPLLSLLLAVWITWGWVSTAREQLNSLSDRRADADDIAIESVQDAVRDALRGEPLDLSGVDAYHAGEGFRLRLDLRPAASSVADPQEELAGVLARASRAARQAAGSAALGVETRIIPRDADAARDFSWVKEYGAVGGSV